MSEPRNKPKSVERDVDWAEKLKASLDDTEPTVEESTAMARDDELEAILRAQLGRKIE